MTKAKSRQRIRSYLATMGWSTPMIEDMLQLPSRQNVEALEDLLVESSQARRALKDCLTYFPNAKLLEISEL